MLVLSRRVGEKIEIGGGITITVLRVSGKTVRLGVDAPDSVPIRRSEIVANSTWTKPPVSSSDDASLLDSSTLQRP